MQALKALVIFMGILIAIGVTVVGVTIYRRATDMVTTEKATEDKPAASGTVNTGAASPKDAAASFGTRELGLPAGSEIVAVQTVALQQGVEQILVHARLPDGGASILVLDPRRGTVAGEWHVRGAADPNAPARP